MQAIAGQSNSPSSSPVISAPDRSSAAFGPHMTDFPRRRAGLKNLPIPRVAIRIFVNLDENGRSADRERDTPCAQYSGGRLLWKKNSTSSRNGRLAVSVKGSLEAIDAR